MSHRYFLFVSMVTKTGFPARVKREYAVSLSDRKPVKRECSVSSAAKPYLPKTTEGRNRRLIKVLTSATPGHLVRIFERLLTGEFDEVQIMVGLALFTSQSAAGLTPNRSLQSE